jgi:hypothetical protein
MKVKKRARQLEQRRQAWAALKNRMDTKARSRYDAGGYREPGSFKHY